MHKPHIINKSYGADSFFTKPVEGYPVDNNLALTHSFIFGGVHHSGTGKSVHMGQFEVDVLWLYILGALIVIGVVVGAIICCCSGDNKKEEKKENKQNEKNTDMEAMAPADMAPADMAPPADPAPPAEGM